MSDAHEGSRSNLPDDSHFSVRVRGVMRDAATGGRLSGGTVCLSRGHARIHGVEPAVNGSFDLTVTGLVRGTYHLTFFADARHARRRAVIVDADLDEDMGVIELAAVEYPPGIHGVLWDGVGDRPLSGGLLRLEQAGELLDETRSGEGGLFQFESTCHRPMPPGPYDIIAEASGYRQARMAATVHAERTVCSVGPLEMFPASR